MTEQHKNPIPEKVRDWIYLISAVASGASLFLPALLAGTPLESSAVWITGSIAGLAALTAILAKSNLGVKGVDYLPSSGTEAELVEVFDDQPVSPAEYRARLEALKAEISPRVDPEIYTRSSLEVDGEAK